MELHLLDPILSVSRLPRGTELVLPSPPPALYSVTWTAEEVSVVSPSGQEPGGARVESGWRALMVDGPLDFTLTGVLADLAGCLAQAGVSLFALSTFDTDYLLVKEEDLARAVAALEGRGHSVAGLEPSSRPTAR